MSSNVYCGARKTPPKGKKFGSMVECAQRKQVRRYGRHKADEKALAVKGAKPVSQLIAEQKAEFAKLTARIGRLKKEFDRAKLSEERKEEIRREHSKAVMDRQTVKRKLAVLVKKTK